MVKDNCKGGLMRALTLTELHEYADALVNTWDGYRFNVEEGKIRPNLKVHKHLQKRLLNVLRIISKRTFWFPKGITYHVVREVQDVNANV